MSQDPTQTAPDVLHYRVTRIEKDFRGIPARIDSLAARQDAMEKTLTYVEASLATNNSLTQATNMSVTKLGTKIDTGVKVVGSLIVVATFAFTAINFFAG